MNSELLSEKPPLLSTAKVVGVCHGECVMLKTKRLILRPWDEADAESLYEYAKDERVGPIAGWPVHTSVENSREVIKEVLFAPESYAVCLKEDNKAIGSISIMIGDKSNIGIPDTEGEIGFWIGVPFWGQGLIPEAAREIIRHAFEDLELEVLWCGHYKSNDKSRRVQEKCGFVYHHTDWFVHLEQMDEIRTEHIIMRLTKDEWNHNEQDHFKRLVELKDEFVEETTIEKYFKK